MSSPPVPNPPPDQDQRERALDPARSVLVQAPAGSGKTNLLTRRFLRLLAEVDAPAQVVAITFTKAAAAEMRHRILGKLEMAAAAEGLPLSADPLSEESLARHALDHSRALGWNLLELPAQLRISTIDAFCRELALLQPLLSGLGGGLDIAGQPTELYRRAARRTLDQIGGSDSPLTGAIDRLLLWRDNNWRELEDQLIQMLTQRDRWMQDFVLAREQDWDALRERLERPFAHAVREALDDVASLLDLVPGARIEAHELARFACGQCNGQRHRSLAELADFPAGPFNDCAELEEAAQAHICLADLLLTGGGTFRQRVDVALGFPTTHPIEKSRILALIAALKSIPGLESALAALRDLPPIRYTDDEWQIVRACFTLLRRAAAELQVVFAESAAVDYTEVSQIAQRVLHADDGLPSDAAIAAADLIRHLLVDEFQDTSRRQHRLLAGLVGAWPDRAGRTCFAVGDPMQSIYFFRDADAELFPRVQHTGLEIPAAEPLLFDPATLTANFRTAPALVARLNQILSSVFSADDGSGIEFTPSVPARDAQPTPTPPFTLNLSFSSQSARSKAIHSTNSDESEKTRAAQIEEIVDLIRSRLPAMEAARLGCDLYRIAVLGRARTALAPIALALREAGIPFRAVELEKLSDRPEILDALALARALLNPEDRVAWLGVLRAPWCGLALADLHQLTSADDTALLARPIPDLLAERIALLSADAQPAVRRALDAAAAASAFRASRPTATLGTWLEHVWLRLGGAACVDAESRPNLNLLWLCLDQLPGGEEDLLGPALAAALEKLTALPDPGATAEHGVQLMTIHKAKGLEFEVVIVPELQARGGAGRPGMLSWLERGLAQPDGSGQITEFLVAPMQSKGAERSTAKAWVDRVRREREAQEDRRILYVALTRARKELHLFARPSYKVESNGNFTLVAPSNSLLATAWPALEDEVRARFAEWHSAAAGQVASIAAAGNVVEMPSPPAKTTLRRLPASYRQPGAPSFPRPSAERVGSRQSYSAETVRLYTRHEGGLISRALGVAVHALLEDLARLRLTLEWDRARAELSRYLPRIGAQARVAGIDRTQAARIAAEALEHALAASRDPVGQWILSPHQDAASEIRWAGIIDGGQRVVQADRVFRAGPAPRHEGEDCWWIVDYKTAHEDGEPAELLPRLRPLFAPQLEAYAALLRNLHGEEIPIHAGLYYPRMLLLDSWEL